MVLFFLPFAPLFFLFSSVFCMSKTDELPQEITVSVLKDLTLQKLTDSQKSALLPLNLIPRLENLCLANKQSFQAIHEACEEESTICNKVIQDLCMNRFRYLKAVALFTIFGKLYKPKAIELTLPLTMLSPDKNYFFQFDSISTLIYKIESSGLELLQKIEGSLIAISIDNQYLLFKNAMNYFFIELKSWKHIATYSGPFDSTTDVIVLNPQGTCYLVENCYKKVRLRGDMEGFEAEYNADPDKLKCIDSEHYLFEIHGKGVPLKYLLYGEMDAKNGQPFLIFPQAYEFTLDRTAAFIRKSRGSSPEQIGKAEDIALCNFTTRQKMVFPSNSSTHSMSKDGKFLVWGCGLIGGFDFSYYEARYKLCDYTDIRYDTEVPGWISQIAISPDGRFALAINGPIPWDWRYAGVTPGWIDDPKTVDQFQVRLYNLFCEPAYARELEFSDSKENFFINQRVLGSVCIEKGKYVKHIGFLENGTQFFICSDTFNIYNMEEFAPREGFSLSSLKQELRYYDPFWLKYVIFLQEMIDINTHIERIDLPYRDLPCLLKFGGRILDFTEDETVIDLFGDGLSITGLSPQSLKAHIIEHFKLQNFESFASQFRFLHVDKAKEKMLLYKYKESRSKLKANVQLSEI